MSLPRIRAISSTAKSSTFRVSTEKDLPVGQEFVIRLDHYNYNGVDKIKTFNPELGINYNHRADWLLDRVAGFRRTQDGVEYIVAEVVTDEMFAQERTERLAKEKQLELPLPTVTELTKETY